MSDSDPPDTTETDGEPRETTELKAPSRLPSHLKPWTSETAPRHGMALLNLPSRVRRLTSDGELLAQFFLSVMLGEIDGARVSDRLEAGKELWNRGFGKSVDVSVTLDASHAQPALEPEALESLARELRRPAPPALTQRSETPALPEPEPLRTGYVPEDPTGTEGQ